MRLTRFRLFLLGGLILTIVGPVAFTQGPGGFGGGGFGKGSKGGRKGFDPESQFKMYSGGKAGLRPIHDALLKLSRSLGDDVRVCPCKTIVPLYRNHVFAEMGATTAETNDVIWNRGGEGETVHCALVSANFFSLLGVRPALGRGFLAAEDQPGSAAAVVVVSHAMWQQRLGADPAVVGQTLTLDGRAFTVVGVAPAGFSGILAGFTPEFWTPLVMHDAISPGLNAAERRQHWLLGLGRFRPGVAPAQVNADLAVLGRQLATDYPDADTNLEPVRVARDAVGTSNCLRGRERAGVVRPHCATGCLTPSRAASSAAMSSFVIWNIA